MLLCSYLCGFRIQNSVMHFGEFTFTLMFFASEIQMVAMAPALGKLLSELLDLFLG